MDETTDQLTGLKCPRALYAELDRLLKAPATQAALFVIDIDRFKAVNDKYDFVAGNDVLHAIAQALARKVDTYRIGGGRFGAIVSSVSKHQALLLAESLRTDIAALAFKGYRELSVTIRVGVAVFPDDANTIDELSRSADAALHKAHHDGGNCVRVYTERVYIESLEAEIAALRKQSERLNTTPATGESAYQRGLESLLVARTEQLRTTVATLERAYDATLDICGEALALRDAETERHSRRVAAFSIAIARKLGLPQKDISVIGRAAFLHDVGKLAIPDAILHKPGSLTEGETAQLRQYVRLGYETIKKVRFLADAAEIVYCHQERCDGTGYPRGLQGEKIPLGARIIAVANTLDAIITNHSYRSAQTFQAARKEIENWSGSQFDPDIVRAFLEIPDTIWADLRSLPSLRAVDQQA